MGSVSSPVTSLPLPHGHLLGTGGWDRGGARSSEYQEKDAHNSDATAGTRQTWPKSQLCQCTASGKSPNSLSLDFSQQ